MSTQRITVAVLGTGPVADLLAQRIQKRADLSLAAVLPSSEAPPSATDCVIYLPTSAELAAGTAAERVTGLLRAGFDVVSTAPPAALRDADAQKADLLGACRAGSSTFHGTGGFQSSLITRFNRAFASITRNIRDIELIEELDVEDMPAHPWTSPADLGFEDNGLDNTESQAINARVAAVEGYYDAGLHTLSEAVFGNDRADESIEFSAARARHDDNPKRGRSGAQDAPDQLIVRRTLGSHVAYDSIWTRRQGSSTPLRYRLNTTSTDAIGHVTITFNAEGEVRPADHLACSGLLDAIRPAYESAPGVLRHELEINHVKTDDRLAH
ncbi:MAG: hypothetical protein HPY82_03760 [Gammaproteobacteria bacterium]|nr:hypothetical protein [Gammaproteobacteria bacterium]